MKLEIQLNSNKCSPANMRFLCEHGIKAAAERCFGNAQEDIRVMGKDKFTGRSQVIRDLDENEVGFLILRKDDEPGAGRSEGASESGGGSEGAEGDGGGVEPAESLARSADLEPAGEAEGEDEFDCPA